MAAELTRGYRAPLAPPSARDLPRQLTSFVGRERDIAAVELLMQTSRLTTLTGAGGVGKTRLALQVATALQLNNAMEVVVVELATLASSAHVPPAVAAALGLVQHSQTWLDVLAGGIRTRRVLLVLDNCEHVVLACSELADGLLKRCPELRILATSREPLAIGGETVWRVPSLSLPAPRERWSAAEIAQSESVQLFVERASAALPSFALTDRNATAVARLCRRLDGIPLALELAAARVSVLPVVQLVDRLDDALRLLITGSRVASARQQTLRATLEWSYQLLSDADQLLFCRLSVFAGGWTLEAAENVCAAEGIEPEEILESLARLVDKSLVLCEIRGDGAARYRLLETLRQLGSELLRQADRTARLRDRHLSWFVRQADHAEARGPEWQRWFPWFHAELDNLRSALDWAIERRHVNEGLRLGAALHPFWLNTIYAAEGRNALEALLRLTDVPADAGPRARCLVGEGNLIRLCGGDLSVARSYADRGLALARAVGDQRVVHHCLRLVGSIAGSQGDDEAATHLLQESVELAKHLGDGWEWELGVSLFLLGSMRRFPEHLPQARPLVQEAICRLRAVGDRLILAHALGFLANIALWESRPDEARRCARESLELHAAVGVFPELVLGVLVRLAATKGHPERAVRLAGAVSAARSRAGMVRVVTWAALLDRARQELGAARAAAVWAEGEAMSLDEATAFALGEPSDAPMPNSQSIHMTKRELEVLRLVAQGKSNREIALALVLSARTVERHIENVYAKIGAHGRVNATAYALRHQLA